MPTGRVKRWFTEKSYGFIEQSTASSGDKDVFVHISAVAAAGLTTLKAGQELEFELGSDFKTGRPCAQKLRLL
jgi:CspA family cold shock protein